MNKKKNLVLEVKKIHIKKKIALNLPLKKNNK